MVQRFSSCVLATLALLTGAHPGTSQDLAESARVDLRGLQTGMVIATYSGDSITSLEALGFQTPRRETPVSAEQIIPFPALSEVIVGITVEALATAEILDLDAPISGYLPGLSPMLGRATLRQLLSHTSGLDDARVRREQTWEEALDGLSDWALLTEPGFIVSRSRYSFPLAVRVLEKVVGRSFSEFATAAVLAPLGLERTTLDPEVARVSGLIDGVGLSTRPDHPFTLIPAESRVRGLPVVFTNAQEAARLLAAWMAGNLRGDVPWESPPQGSTGEDAESTGEDAESTGEDAGPTPNDAGFRNGVIVDEFLGQLRVSRSAVDLGFGTALSFFPEVNRGVVVWATAAEPGETFRFLQEQVVPDRPQPGPDAVGISPSQSDISGIPFHPSGWTGEYRNGDEILQVRQSDGQMTIFTGTGELTVRPSEDGMMVVTLEDGRATDITFRLVLDEKNRRYLVRGSKTNPKAFLHEEDRKW